jgi:hypothetical protein
MDHTAIKTSLIAAFFLAFAVCAARRGAGDPGPASNPHEQVARSGQTTDSQAGESKPPAASQSASQKSTATGDGGKIQAEIVWRDGTVTRGEPTS